jgi:hypothetical protein
MEIYTAALWRCEMKCAHSSPFLQSDCRAEQAKSTQWPREDWKISPAEDFIEPLTKLVALMLQIESTMSKSPRGINARWEI